jgi:FAD-dependent oxidoreductase domain-containing protein 1
MRGHVIQFIVLDIKFLKNINTLGSSGIRKMPKEDIFPFTILPGPAIDMGPDPKSKMFWVSYNEGVGRSFSLEENPSAERVYYSNNLYAVLREYVPAFADSRVFLSRAGYYSMNNMDGTYVLEKSMNLSVLNGSSGSGIMKADSAGRLTSALISGRESARLWDGS